MPNNENSFTHDGVEFVAVDGVAVCLWCDLKSRIHHTWEE